MSDPVPSFRAVSTTPNKRDYLDRDLNRDSDSTRSETFSNKRDYLRRDVCGNAPLKSHRFF